MLRRAVAFAAVAALGWPSAARADEARPSSLSWTRLTGAESCIAARDLARAIEKKLGRAVFVSAATAELTVEGRVERASPRGWRATIVATRADGAAVGRRELHVASGKCGLLDESLVLVIALMIDPNAGAAGQAPPPAPPPPPAAEPRTIVIEVPVPAPPARWSGDARASVFGLAAGTGAIVPGLRISASVLPPGLVPLELQANASGLTRTVDGALALRFIYGGLAICPTLVGEPGAPRLAACAGLDIGDVHGSTAQTDRDDVLYAGSARLGFAAPLFGGEAWSFEVRAEAELLAFFRRPSYSVTAFDPTQLETHDVSLYALPLWGGTAAAGFGLEFR